MFLLKLLPRAKKLKKLFSLHSIMFLLKRFLIGLCAVFLKPLHSTMFLLKPSFDSAAFSADSPLHSTMFLLKHQLLRFVVVHVVTLHSTMFLLKPMHFRRCSLRSTLFTFHNVSIKTPGNPGCPSNLLYLYIPQCFY